MTKIVIDTNSIAKEVAKQGRVNRSPEHPFYLSTSPWAIQPFMISPVLPGETMKNALLQARIVTDPIKSPLMGWHAEFYVFYVKLRDLDQRDLLTEMLLDPGLDLTPLRGDYDERCHTLKGQINYTRMCLDRVVAEYFRDEGDNPAYLDDPDAEGGKIGVPPATYATKETWMDSVKLESAMPAGDTGELPYADDNRDENIPPQWANHYTQWERMRALKLTEVTFEDWLRQFGVNAPKEVKEDLHRPELLRYVRDWSYPSNNVDAATGAVNTVLSWSIAERIDKDRFFKEPGFIFGVTVTRPKVYLGREYGSAVSMLEGAYSWLPALMQSDPWTSLKRFANTEGPLGHPDDAAARPAEAYWVDLRDLFLYGGSFSNVWYGTAGTEDGGRNIIMAPKADMERRYATQADVNALFKVAEKNRVRMDGVVQLTIAGHQRDTT